MFVQIIKFLIYSGFIVIISKYLLVKVLRKLAEGLNLKAKTVGNITGLATSVPELLTISFSAYSGFMSASVYNVISSNIINFVQYMASIFLNKNIRNLENTAIRVDLSLSIFTIIIPVLLIIFDIEVNLSIVPIFLLLFIAFYIISNNAHKLYLKFEDKKLQINIEYEKKWIKGKGKIIAKYSIYLVLISIGLFVVGDLLSDVLESLCVSFNVPEIIIGILLGFITSIPELITFFESQKHYKKQKNEKLGVVESTNNLLTSNMINLFAIQSIAIIIYALIKA